MYVSYLLYYVPCLGNSWSTWLISSISVEIIGVFFKPHVLSFAFFINICRMRCNLLCWLYFVPFHFPILVMKTELLPYQVMYKESRLLGRVVQLALACVCAQCVVTALLNWILCPHVIACLQMIIITVHVMLSSLQHWSSSVEGEKSKQSSVLLKLSVLVSMFITI